MIPYEDLKGVNAPYFTELEKAAREVIESGWYILGKNVVRFEQQFSDFLYIDHAIGVGNGLDALRIALQSLDLPSKSEVIVPANTYIATIIAIKQLGLVPVLVEPDIHTYNLAPDALRKAITPKTSAVMVVHLYGKPSPMPEIMKITEEHGLPVIEDCAQAHGAKIDGRQVGTFGVVNAFSFYPSKNLGALGDAGLIATNDENLSERCRSLRNYGSAKKYVFDDIGWNSRLDEMQAALLSVKLKYLTKLVEHKRKLASVYFEEIKNPAVVLPTVQEGVFDAYHIFNIRHEMRDQLKQYLEENGVQTEIHYPIPPHKQKCLQEFADLKLPITEEIHATTLSLPISWIHSENDIRYISEAINRF